MRLSLDDFSAEDFRARFGESEWLALTQRGISPSISAQAGTSDEGAENLLQGERDKVFTAALEDSIAEINSRLAGHFTHLEKTPVLLIMLLADLVRARLYADSPTQIVIKRQTEARRLLDDIAQGRRELDPAAASLNAPIINTPKRIFTESRLDNYHSSS